MKLLTKGKPFKVLLIFSLPLIFGALLSQTYNLVDLIIAGKCIGDDALSATGATSTLIQFISALFWGFGVALATIIGEQYGRKNYKTIIKTIKSSLLLVFVAMFFLISIIEIASEWILTLLNVDELIFDNALLYFRVFLIALLFQSIYNEISSILNSLGNSRFPMIVIAISSVLNICLNLLFILGLNLGILGIALATVISSFVTLLIGLFKIAQTINELGGDMTIFYSNSFLKPVFKIAIPCILQQLVLYFSSLMVQPYINALGKDVTAGYSIGINISLFCDAIYHGVSMAIATYASQSRGEQKFENYSKGIRIGLILQLIFTLPLVIILFIFPNEACMLFLRNRDSDCLPYATQFIFLCLPFLFFTCFVNLMHSFFKAVKAVNCVLISTTLYSISRIAFTYLLPNNEYIFAVYLALSLSWVVESIALIIIYYSKLWIKKDEKELLEKKIVG